MFFTLFWFGLFRLEEKIAYMETERKSKMSDYPVYMLQIFKVYYHVSHWYVNISLMFLWLFQSFGNVHMNEANKVSQQFEAFHLLSLFIYYMNAMTM